MSKRLHRSRNKMISGVCSGIADYFNVDPTIVRLLWAILTVVSFGLGGIIIYIICAIVIPEA